MNKKILTIIIVVLAVVLGAGVYFWSLQPGAGSSSADWKVLKENSFTVEYPTDFEVEKGAELGGSYLAPTIAKISFPEVAFKDEKSNFVEAFLTVSRSDQAAALKSCDTFEDVPNPARSGSFPEVINGATFKTQATVGVAAGNLYASKIYRTLHDDSCYEMALTVHTGNLNNYPENTVKEFDRVQAFTILEQIANTFRFVR